MRAVFLDRDGVINEDGLIDEWEKIKIYKNAAKAIKIINELKIPAIVITNQPVVARGMCTEDDVKKINELLKKEMKKSEAAIDAFYFCPHHPDKGFPEENPLYKINCECRKPKTGMLLKAKSDFNLDLEFCFLIGDQTADIKAGKDSGCTTILVKTGQAGSDKKYDAAPDYICDDILEAALVIKKIY